MIIVKTEIKRNGGFIIINKMKLPRIGLVVEFNEGESSRLFGVEVLRNVNIFHLNIFSPLTMCFSLLF